MVVQPITSITLSLLCKPSTTIKYPAAIVGKDANKIKNIFLYKKNLKISSLKNNYGHKRSYMNTYIKQKV